MADSPRFTWDAELGRFRYAASGRLVSTKLIRDAVDTALQNQQARAAQLLERLRSGQIELAEWELAMRRVVKDSHLYTTAAARGGFEQLTAQDYGRVGGTVAREYAYLRRFREGIEDGSRPLDGRAVSDATLYPEAARRTYHDAEKVTRVEAGHDEVRNVLHPADHCGECEDLAAAGFMPVQDMPSPGTRECGPRCKCTLEYAPAVA